jgi:hypothetical protein
MAEHPFQSWLEKAAVYSSVLACGVYLGPQSMAVRSFSESFPEPQIKELLQRLAEIALGLRVYQLSGSRLRWAFENGQFQIARRPDGAIAVLAMNQDPTAAATMEELFEIFMSTVCAPEKPTTRLPEAAESGEK